jgi:hypothetical protein
MLSFVVDQRELLASHNPEELTLRKTDLCRVSKSSLCALYRAQDNDHVCRAFFKGRTAKKKRTAKVLFAVH